MLAWQWYKELKLPFVPLCSIYLWCNQNVFKRILQWTNTIYSGSFNISTTNCSLKIFAKSLDGLPRTGFATPTHSANYGNQLSEKSESFFYVALARGALSSFFSKKWDSASHRTTRYAGTHWLLYKNTSFRYTIVSVQVTIAKKGMTY